MLELGHAADRPRLSVIALDWPLSGNHAMERFTRQDVVKQSNGRNPRTRHTTAQVVDEDTVSDDRAVYVKEEISYLEEDLTMRQVTVISSRVCECCGALLSEANKLAGRARTMFVCQECAVRCTRCAKILAPAEARRLLGRSYCGRCLWLTALRLLFVGGGHEETQQ